MSRREIAIVAGLGALVTALITLVAGLSIAAGIVLSWFIVPALIVGYRGLRPPVWRGVVVRIIARRGIHRMEAWLLEQRLQRRDRS